MAVKPSKAGDSRKKPKKASKQKTAPRTNRKRVKKKKGTVASKRSARAESKRTSIRETRVKDTPMDVISRWESRILERCGSSLRVLNRSHAFVNAAFELITEGGLEALRLRPLLDRTGLSRRAFYDRFDSMDSLILALFESCMRESAKLLREAIQDVETGIEKLEVLVRLMCLPSVTEPLERARIALSVERARLAQQRTDELRHAEEHFDRVYVEVLEMGIKDGTIRKLDIKRTAQLIHQLIAVMVHRSFYCETGIETELECLIDFFLSATKAK